MSATVRWRLRRLVQNQAVLFVLELVLLLLPILGTFFPFFGVVSIFFVAPIVVVLAAAWCWFEYARGYQHPFVETLARLEDLVEDFGRINFQASITTEDSRVIKLLEAVTITPSEAPAEFPAEKIEGVKGTYNTFQLWHLTLRDMIKMMARKGSLLARDLVDVVNYFIEFYNGFVNNVAETTLTILSKGEPNEPQKVKEIFSIYRDSMAHLRGRANDFLKDLVDKGLLISGIEVKALRPELG